MPTPKNVAELLQDLVAIPSVNPQGNPGTDKTGEQALGEYVADFLRALGAEATLDSVEPGRPNVVATFSPDKPTAHLAFAPHLDTVSVAGMTIAPFDPVIRDGKLFGRGSTDTKGPMAAALWAVREWAQSSARVKSRIRWSFLALMGEEGNNAGKKINFSQHAHGTAWRGEKPAQERVDPGASSIELAVFTRIGGKRGGGIVPGQSRERSVGGEESGREREDDAFAGERLDDAGGVAEQPDATRAGAGRRARSEEHTSELQSQ